VEKRAKETRLNKAFRENLLRGGKKIQENEEGEK